MTIPTDYRSHERRIASLLLYGTWLASIIITTGVALNIYQDSSKVIFLNGFDGNAVMRLGIALLIFLPIARVTLMLITFLRERDFTFAAISSLVLTIIVISFFVAL